MRRYAPVQGGERQETCEQDIPTSRTKRKRLSQAAGLLVGLLAVLTAASLFAHFRSTSDHFQPFQGFATPLPIDRIVVVTDTDGVRYRGFAYDINDDPQDDDGGGRTKRAYNYKRDAYPLARGCIWLGIPYAQPISDADRFEPPRSINFTTGDSPSIVGVIDGLKFGKVCPQGGPPNQSRYGNTVLEESPDCLNLNILAPNCNGSGGYAVTIFLHDGDFKYGSNMDNGLLGPLHNYVSQGNVLVIPNYRINSFGLYHPEQKCRLGYCGERSGGNRLLLDIKEILKWVNRNIHIFGGDPSRITLAGVGSGACAASVLALQSLGEEGSELEDHIHSLLLQSGTSETCTRTVFDDHAREELTLEACTGRGLHEDCLRELNTTSIMEFENMVHSPSWNIETKYGKYRNASRLTQLARKAGKGKKLRVLLATSGNEWSEIGPRVRKYMNLRTEEMGLEFIKGALSSIFGSIETVEEKAECNRLWDKIIDHYSSLVGYGPSHPTTTPEAYFTQLYETILNDAWLRYYVVKEARRYSDLGGEVYFLHFAPNRSFDTGQAPSLSSAATYAFMPENKWEKLSDEQSIRREQWPAGHLGWMYSAFSRGKSYFSGRDATSHSPESVELERFENQNSGRYPFLLINTSHDAYVFNSAADEQFFSAQREALWEEFWNLSARYKTIEHLRVRYGPNYRSEEVRTILKQLQKLGNGEPESSVNSAEPQDNDVDADNDEPDIEEYLYQGDIQLTVRQARLILKEAQAITMHGEL